LSPSPSKLTKYLVTTRRRMQKPALKAVSCRSKRSNHRTQLKVQRTPWQQIAGRVLGFQEFGKADANFQDVLLTPALQHLLPKLNLW
jgi:hypothetical protein